MTARVFISYRTSDGKDNATALARDLGVALGRDTVFLDKDDLAAGGRWRAELQRSVGASAVVLLVLTPDYLGARTADGARRIDAADDPVRLELDAALQAGAHVIPLLADGAAPPDATGLPAPFDRIAQLTWRPLRAYDWPADVARLVDDLRARGLGRAAPRRQLLFAGAAALALAAGVSGWWAWRGGSGVADPTGPWTLAGPGLPSTRLNLRRLDVEASAPEGAPWRLALVGEPIRVADDPAWQPYRRFWKERTGHALDAVVWRGEGTLTRDDAGNPAQLEIALRVLPAGTAAARGADGGLIDTGSLVASMPAGRARSVEARLWWTSEQKESAVVLQRGAR